MGNKNNIWRFAGVSILLIAVALIIIRQPAITGFATAAGGAPSYSDNLNIETSENREVVWNVTNPGELSSIRATGKVTKQGSAKLYVQQGKKRFLILDSALLAGRALIPLELLIGSIFSLLLIFAFIQASKRTGKLVKKKFEVSDKDVKELKATIQCVWQEMQDLKFLDPAAACGECEYCQRFS